MKAFGYTLLVLVLLAVVCCDLPRQGGACNCYKGQVQCCIVVAKW